MSIWCMSRRCWNAGDVTELEPVWEQYSDIVIVSKVSCGHVCSGFVRKSGPFCHRLLHSS